jgi:hypothetical protein
MGMQPTRPMTFAPRFVDEPIRPLAAKAAANDMFAANRFSDLFSDRMLRSAQSTRCGQDRDCDGAALAVAWTERSTPILVRQSIRAARCLT